MMTSCKSRREDKDVNNCYITQHLLHLHIAHLSQDGEPLVWSCWILSWTKWSQTAVRLFSFGDYLQTTQRIDPTSFAHNISSRSPYLLVIDLYRQTVCILHIGCSFAFQWSEIQRVFFSCQPNGRQALEISCLLVSLDATFHQVYVT